MKKPYKPPSVTTTLLQPLSEETPKASAAFVMRIPMELKLSLNSRVHWGVRARRVAAERAIVAFAFPHTWKGTAERSEEKGFRWIVVLTRVAPRRLDDDNLAGRFKAVRDEIARQLGIDDGSSRIAWVYSQTKGEPGETAVLIEVRVLEEDA